MITRESSRIFLFKVKTLSCLNPQPRSLLVFFLYHAVMRDVASEIRKLQELRSRRQRDCSISDTIESIQCEASRTQRKLGALIELWSDLVPDEIACATMLIRIRGGVLSVAADSSAVAFELDRCLREGLLTDLRKRYKGTLTRIKVQTGFPRQP